MMSNMYQLNQMQHGCNSPDASASGLYPGSFQWLWRELIQNILFQFRGLLQEKSRHVIP